MDKLKQVILIRKDLKMRRGKEISQGSHASMMFLLQQKFHDFDPLLEHKCKEWFLKGMTKICCKVNSENELLAYHARAKLAGIETHLIMDAGHTEFKGVPTYTTCAIGPDYEDEIDKITGDLELY